MHRLAPLPMVLALLLAGCMPVTGIATMLRDDQGAALHLRSSAGGASITFAAGTAAAQEVALYIGGADLSVDDPACAPVENGIGCTLGDLAAGETYELTVSGSRLSANVSFYRDGSAQPRFFLAELL